MGKTPRSSLSHREFVRQLLQECRDYDLSNAPQELIVAHRRLQERLLGRMANNSEDDDEEEPRS